MGVFYNSICVPGRRGEEVRRLLTRWLAVRGFEPRPGPVLFDLDDADERSAYLLHGERWTLLFFSHYEEDRRLIYELGELERPLLYLWVHDSDVWGWDLFAGRELAGSFNSDPSSYESFDDLPMGSPERPAGEPAELCRRFGLDPDLGVRIAQLQQRRGAFQEEVCAELAGLLGAGPAASSYDDLERGALELLDGWRCEHLFFVRRGSDERIERVDLHQHRVTRWLPGIATRPESTQLEISPEILREMARMRRRMRLTMVWLRPLAWLARTWRRLTEAAARLRWSLRAGAAHRTTEAPSLASYRRLGRRLINDRHRCSIELPEGVEPTPAPSRPPLVFAFTVRRVGVTCTARRPHHLDEVLRRPSRSQVIRDEKYEVGGLRARHVLFELPPEFIAGGKEASTLGMHVIQTEAALYVFLYRHPGKPAPAVELAIRTVVESFRLAPGTG